MARLCFFVCLGIFGNVDIFLYHMLVVFVLFFGTSVLILFATVVALFNIYSAWFFNFPCFFSFFGLSSSSLQTTDCTVAVLTCYLAVSSTV